MIFEYLIQNKDWIFSGIGITIGGIIVKTIRNRFRKNRDEKKDNITPNKIQDIKGNNNIIISDSEKVVINKDNISSQTFQYNTNNRTAFSRRFEKTIELLNDARKYNEKEYTVEYISYRLGLRNVEELQKYIQKGKEPDDKFKGKFANIFGLNKDWMIYNRGEFPFASNIKFKGNNPMDILRNTKLTDIQKFIVVIGVVQKKRWVCIIRKMSDICYEVYPKKFVFNSQVGMTGARELTEFYRFLRETTKIKKIEEIIYDANEEQFKMLMNGEIYPKKVEKFRISKDFILNFLDISEKGIKSNREYWGEEFAKIQEIIAENLHSMDKINEEDDNEKIMENLKDETNEKKEGNIDLFETPTLFFSYRFGKAFPGIRKVKEFNNPKECVDRLKVLLKPPLSGEKLGDPIWWLRGGRNSEIGEIKIVSNDKILMDGQEIKVKRIIACPMDRYYKKFVYVESYPEEPTGLYEMDKSLLKEFKKSDGFLNEEYAVFKGKKIDRAEYDDGATIIDGKPVELDMTAEIRIRYITAYNFVICAKFNPMNNHIYDNEIESLLNGMIENKKTIDDFIKYVEKIPKKQNY